MDLFSPDTCPTSDPSPNRFHARAFQLPETLDTLRQLEEPPDRTGISGATAAEVVSISFLLVTCQKLAARSPTDFAWFGSGCMFGRRGRDDETSERSRSDWRKFGPSGAELARHVLICLGATYESKQIDIHIYI